MGNALLRAGRLTRPVTIVRGGAPVEDEYRDVATSAAEETHVMGGVAPAPGVERFGNAELAATALTRFVFRYRTDLLRVTDQLRFDGRVYDISSVTEIGQREGWEVLAGARKE